MHGEIVAEHPHAFFFALAEQRDGGRRRGSARDVGKDFEVDGSLKGHSQLIRRKSLMDPPRIGRAGIDFRGHVHLYSGIVRETVTHAAKPLC